MTSVLSLVTLSIIFPVLVPTKSYGRVVSSEFANNNVAKTKMRDERSLFVFGDSLFDSGNNQYYTPDEYIQANHNPYGMSSNEPTGRYSDGLLVPDFIAEFAELPHIPPALDPDGNGTYGYNFASAGSGILDLSADVISLDEQLSMYKNKTRNMEDKSAVKNGVYLFSAGGNDYFSFNSNNKTATEAQAQAHVNLVIERLISVVKEIYGVGARKFVFQDVGPLGCIPGTKYTMNETSSCYEKINVLARLHNAALKDALYELKNSTQYSQIKYGVFDYYNQLSLLISNATSYGFVESEIACCGYGGGVNGENCGTSPYFLCTNPSVFVMFDGGHTTQAANSHLAKLMWNGDQTLIAPYNIRQLFELHD